MDTVSNDALAAMVEPSISATAAFGTTGAYTPNGAGGNQTHQEVTIGQVNLGDQGAVKEFFKQLNNDTMNVGMNMTPLQGAQ